MANSNQILRRIPKVDLVLDSAHFEPLLEAFPRRQAVRQLREHLDELRTRALADRLDLQELEEDQIVSAVAARLKAWATPYYRRVINATGVILHTALGRATLPREVSETLGRIASYPQRVEILLESGERGGRDDGCAQLLCDLVGCEAATVVNNNAAATMLVLGALARDREVVLSRGELVEIGGSYRVPEILRESGCTLREVGTTNRTHLKDYRNALGDDTGLLLKVHTSNYRVVGFTEEVSLAELVKLGREHGVPTAYDLGSGCLIDLAAQGYPGEELVQEAVASGADLVSFSGDKLLGGPQAGIIVGREEAVEACRRHPLFRAMRPGRLIYTALEAVLRIYLEGSEEALARIPALQRLTTPSETLQARAEELARRLEPIPSIHPSVSRCYSQAGSGSLPAREYPSWGVQVRTSGSASLDDMAARLRTGVPSVLCLTRDQHLLFDVRTLEEEEVPLLAQRIGELAAGTNGAETDAAGGEN